MDLAESVSWQTSHDDEVWGRAAAVGRPGTTIAPCGHCDVLHEWSVLSLGPALPASEHGHLVQLQVVRAALPGEHPVFWSLGLHPRPQGIPPASLLAVSDQLGGQAGLLELVRRGARGGPIPIAEYTLAYELAEAEWSCTLLPRPFDDTERRALSAISEEGAVEQLGVRLSGGTLGLKEVNVAYEHRLKAFRARLVARAPLELGEGFSVPLRSELMAVLTGRLFVPARKDELREGSR